MKSIKGTITEYPVEPEIIRFSPIGNSKIYGLVTLNGSTVWKVVDFPKKRKRKSNGI